MMERKDFDNESCAGGPSGQVQRPTTALPVRPSIVVAHKGGGDLRCFFILDSSVARKPVQYVCQRRPPSQARHLRPSPHLLSPGLGGSWYVSELIIRTCLSIDHSSYFFSDLQAQTAHVVRLIKAGVKPLLAGTMGEAHHLSHQERVDLIKAARQALDDAGSKDIPIISGSGAGSTRETIELSKEAAAAGADYVIVIISGYFAGALAGNKKALKAFWSEVSEKSPIPVIIYNCKFDAS